ncbi:MAG: ADP-ribosylglycohydrolase family protein [Rhizobiales bacterium]|nr:ADP-ribosylglycohydrolase family protein [Hyphomicrobiales bacterium]NRB13880.1 ADP-ribosylglycohydrolase family protein [Hyphomicrobiales bacterium]
MSVTQETDFSFAGKVRGLVHGVAFGDAMGAPVEKLSAGDIRKRYGRVDDLNTKWHRDSQSEQMRKGRVRGAGIVTDDTLMTLALMEVYNDVNRHIDAWDMADGMVREIAWRQRWIPELQKETALIERLFYPEKWIFQRHQLSSCDPRQGGIGNMVNCGAAMYIAPIGVVNACNPQDAYNEAIAFASGHQQSYGLEAAGVVAGAVAAAFTPNISVSEIANIALSLAKDGTHNAIYEILEVAEDLRQKGAENDEVIDVFLKTITPFSPMGDDLNHTVNKVGKASPNYQPSRFLSIEELPLALGFCLVANGEFKKAIVDGINSGRDTDSIGVMIGAILGAMHGQSIVDEADEHQLNEANRLDIAAETATFVRTAQTILTDDEKRLHAVQNQRFKLLKDL